MSTAVFLFQHDTPLTRVEPHFDVDLPAPQRVIQFGQCAVHRENDCGWNVLPRPNLRITSLYYGDTLRGDAGRGVVGAGPLNPHSTHSAAHEVRHGEGVKTLAIVCRPIVVGDQVDFPVQQGLTKLTERHRLEVDPLDA